MTEESTEPDWDGILGRLDGQPSPDELREAREDGARAMMDMLLGVAVKYKRGISQQAVRDTGFRIMVAAYLAQNPVTKDAGSIQKLAQLCGVSSSWARVLVSQISKQTGLLGPVPNKRRGHRRS